MLITLTIIIGLFLNKNIPQYMNRNTLTIIGFLLFMFAAISILISMVGLQISFMNG